MTAHQADARVHAYTDALPERQQEICQQVRDLVHGADPEVGPGDPDEIAAAQLLNGGA